MERIDPPEMKKEISKVQIKRMNIKDNKNCFGIRTVRLVCVLLWGFLFRSGDYLYNMN